ncbi:MAG: hypothetical protein ACE5NG_06295, partial [bacterium]
MKIANFYILLVLIWGSSQTLSAQPIEMKLEEQMVSLERDVVRIYNELQKFLIEDPRRGHE